MQRHRKPLLLKDRKKMIIKNLFVLVVFSFFLGGCATMFNGFDKTDTPSAKKLVDAKETVQNSSNELGFNYQFIRKNGTPLLQVDVQRYTSQQVNVRNTYETDVETKSELNGHGHFLRSWDAGWFAVGALCATIPLWQQPDQHPYGDSTVGISQQDIQNIQYGGFGLMAISGVSFLIDTLSQGTNSHVQTDVENKTVYKKVNEAPCSGCLVTLDLGDKGKTDFKTGDDGTINIDLNKLSALEGRWAEVPWGKLSANDNQNNAVTNVVIDPTWADEHEKLLVKNHLAIVAELIKTKKYREAFEKLSAWKSRIDEDDWDFYIAKLKGPLDLNVDDVTYNKSIKKSGGTTEEYDEQFRFYTLGQRGTAENGNVVIGNIKIVQRVNSSCFLISYEPQEGYINFYYLTHASKLNAVDDQRVLIRAQVDGTETYTTTLGVQKTVVALRLLKCSINGTTGIKGD
jgi:hypothetical protein